jgi:hypothetical protein
MTSRTRTINFRRACLLPNGVAFTPRRHLLTRPLTATVVGLAMVTAQPLHVRADEHLYGSIYVAAEGAYGYGNKYTNQAAAMATAASTCKAASGGRPCTKLLVFDRQCAAVVVAERGGEVVDVSGAAELLQADADDRAMAYCRRNNPDADCRITARICSDRP